MNDSTAGSTTLPTSTSAARPRATWLTRLALLSLFALNLATLAGGAWLWRQLDLASHEQALLQQTLQQQTAIAGELKGKLEEQVASENRFRSQTTEILKDTSEKLRGLDRIDTSYWRLAEAEFLLKQAHQRLFITRDADTADLLLASADGALLQQKDPGLLPVRSAIAHDRAALRKVPRIDREGVYLRLEALSAQVGALTQENRFLPTMMEEEIPAEDPLAGYGQMLWQRLLSIIRIRHHDQPVLPLLPPEQEMYLKQNLQLALVQAQLGLLQSQQQTYTGNLERAHAWVSQYCQTSDPMVASWLEETQALMRLNIAPELPDISGSLRSVQKLIEQRAEDIQRALMLDESNAPDDAGEAGAAAEGGEMP